ncbi:MAG: PLP-dependent aspartate aminotransferase family protein [Bryobacteraceae bacterium]|nr:PLP-dependent aspartate aminotransferase family protein [Bryobacteraceae bacterium]
MAKKTKMRQDTQVLTQGFDPRLSVGSARPAVFRSSTYVFSTPEAAERAFDVASGRAEAEPDERIELIYSRINHPNAEIFEDQIVPLETGATGAVVFNSGMAAIMTALMANLQPGDAVVYTVPLYGGTQKLMEDFLPAWGVRTVPVVAGDRLAMERAIAATEKLKVVFLESPANPTLVMSDIRAAAAAAGDALLLVDNTFLGPVFQHPLALGADIVLYSATKYLGGFSDVIGGVALAADPAHVKLLRGYRILFGNILPPDECWILDSRLPTVKLRMNRQSKNAQRIAEGLDGHPALTHVYYPTLFTDPEQQRVYAAQCDFPGGMLSIELKGGKPAAFEFLRRLKIGRNAVSLGGVETLVCHPKSTTHSGLSQEACRVAGISDGLVRLSIGIEDWRDLLADFEQALES